MNNINSVLLCHIGVEFVVIAGITFYLNKKINSLDDKINIMRDTLLKYEEIIQNQQQMLIRHEQIIRQLTGGIQSQQQLNMNSMNDRRMRRYTDILNEQTEQYQEPVHSDRTSNKGIFEEIEETDEEMVKELDEILGPEIQMLQTNYEDVEDNNDKPIENANDCDEDYCDLKTDEDIATIKKRNSKEDL